MTPKYALYVTLLSLWFVQEIKMEENVTDTNIQRVVGDDASLMRYLFNETDPNKYNKYARPIKNGGSPLQIRIMFFLQAVQDLNEKDLILSTLGFFTMIWEDQNLVWNPSDYGDIYEISMPIKEIWHPDIIIKNSADMYYGELFNPERFSATVTSDGWVYFYPGGRILTTCQLDLSFFPVDSHYCNIELESWTENTDRLTFDKVVVSSNEDVKMYVPWSVEELNATYNDESSYANIVYSLKLKRKPAYYLVTIIIPCIIMTSLSVFVLLVPSETGEKVSLQVTILLSFSVFQLIIDNKTPEKSKELPWITVYIFFSMAVVSASLISTLFIQRLLRAHFTTFPFWLKFITFRIIARIVCYKKDFESNYLQLSNTVKLSDNQNDNAMVNENQSELCDNGISFISHQGLDTSSYDSKVSTERFKKSFVEAIRDPTMLGATNRQKPDRKSFNEATSKKNNCLELSSHVGKEHTQKNTPNQISNNDTLAEQAGEIWDKFALILYAVLVASATIALIVTYIVISLKKPKVPDPDFRHSDTVSTSPTATFTSPLN